jgi:hypothetical protein
VAEKSGQGRKSGPEGVLRFRWLWCTPSHRFSVLQGWRHGVRSRSLGGTRYCPTKNGELPLVSRPVGRLVSVWRSPGPKGHIRCGLLLSRLAEGRERGCGCPVGSCDQHSAACPMLVMAHAGPSSHGFCGSSPSREERFYVLSGQNPVG